MLSTSPFDSLAADYDDEFSRGSIGRLLRARVWQRLDSRFEAGQRVLELNCGTGEDALHLARRGIEVLATDSSAEMVQVAREKLSRAGLGDRVRVEQLAMESLGRLTAPPFDGALSNFGGLNCVADLSVVSETLAAQLRPGAIAVLCLMGPLVPWEWIWFLSRGQPGKAFRRLKRGGVDWRGIKVRYPSIGTLCRSFSPHFRLSRAAALGVFLPPTYAEPWAVKHQVLLRGLDRWESRIETCRPFAWLADHYLLEMKREASSR